MHLLRIMHLESRDVSVFFQSRKQECLRIWFSNLLPEILHLEDELICSYKFPMSDLINVLSSIEKCIVLGEKKVLFFGKSVRGFYLFKELNKFQAE